MGQLFVRKFVTPKLFAYNVSSDVYSRVPNKRRGGLIIVLALENQKNNRPKTKNYITEGHKKISKQEVDPPTPRKFAYIQNLRTLLFLINGGGSTSCFVIFLWPSVM